MGDADIMALAVERWDMGRGVQPTDLEARVIASAWHGGQASGLYALASSGAVTQDTRDELEREIRANPDALELQALSSYLHGMLLRGPQQGWSDLHW